MQVFHVASPLMRSFFLLQLCSSLLLLNACTSKSSNDDGTEKEAKEPMDHSTHGGMFAQRITYADSINEGIIEKDTLKTSVRRVAMENVGDCHVHIEYGSPGVRGRNIWGGLVAYDEVWAAGAHSATSIRFSKPIAIDGKRIEPGTYGFFAIPGQNQWTLILNTHYKQHLADDYNAAEDVVRVLVKPEESKLVPRLTYQVFPIDDKNGKVVFSWEKVSATLPFEVLD